MFKSLPCASSPSTRPACTPRDSSGGSSSSSSSSGAWRARFTAPRGAKACMRDAASASGQPHLPAAPAATPRLHPEPPPPSSSSRRQLLLLLGSAAALSLGPSTHSAVAAPAPRTDQPINLEGNVYLLTSSEAENITLAERQVLQLNKRVQTQNRAPADFPSFIRAGFDIKVIAPGFTLTPEGIIYKDFTEGTGSTPEDTQEVVFNYNGFNESGTPIDSSYRKGRPAQTQLGTGGLIPGFEMALRSMKVGTQRRFIVPPALGPPVGPSTFFSAKQCEVFDVEVLAIHTCSRQQSLMFSNVVCE